MRYLARSDGKIQLEKKDDMLKRGVPSPDRADALVMAVWGRKRVGRRMGPGKGADDRRREHNAPGIAGSMGVGGGAGGFAESMGVRKDGGLNML